MRLSKASGIILTFFLLILAFALPASAQEDSQEAVIDFSGEISAIDGSIITVNGLTVQTDQAQFTGTLQVGDQVQIHGVLQPDGVIVAQEIVRLDESVPEPEATPEVSIDIDNNVIIVVEGPVQAVNVNIITIYNINIVVAEDDPLLTVINIGDHLRVEGVIDNDFDLVDFNDQVGGPNISIVVIAINITFINIDVYIGDNHQVWRDPGNCQNPPPPWAPANGWRRRCENRGASNRGGSNRGSGRS